MPSPLAVLMLATDVVVAVSDGRITAQEARDLLEEAGEALDLGDFTEFTGFVVDLLTRTPDELDRAAIKLEARGKTHRAAKLRARATERRRS